MKDARSTKSNFGATPQFAEDAMAITPRNGELSATHTTAATTPRSDRMLFSPTTDTNHLSSEVISFFPNIKQFH